MARFQVADGTQVNVDGVLYPAGATVEVSETDRAARLVAAGVLAPVPAKKRPARAK